MSFSLKLLLLAGSLLLAGVDRAVSQTQAQIMFDGLERVYSGATQLPSIITVPNGLQVKTTVTPRDGQNETVFKTMPAVVDLSYSSSPLYGTTSKAIGDIVSLGGTKRMLESVDVLLVNWAKAADWPALAAQNSRGYYHPITIYVYRRNADQSLSILGQKTQEILIPWRPAVLGDGSTYPYNGYAFKARINFPLGITLSESVAVLAGFNTQNTGFSPIGVAGPYNFLNIALGGAVPSPGVNIEPAATLRYDTTFNAVNSTTAPMFEIRALPAVPVSADSINSGVYTLSATVSSPGYQGSATTEFTVFPSPVTMTLGGLKQIPNGNPRTVTVTTNPPGQTYTVLYAGLSTAPSVPGNYPVIVNITTANRSGQATGILSIGSSMASWLAPAITAGTLNPAKAGPADDPDGDGVPNLLEYAFGLDPVSPGNYGKGGGQMLISNTASNFVVTYRKQMWTVDLTYQLQTSTDLGSTWTSVPTTPTPIATEGEVQSMRVTVPKLAGESRRFFRMLVTRGTF
jgi:hypothetical protein